MTPLELNRILDVLRTGTVNRPGKGVRALLIQSGWRGERVLGPDLTARIKGRLATEHGVNPAFFETTGKTALPKSRTETLGLLRDEKAGRSRTRRPVILRHQPGGALRLGDIETRLPPGGALHVEVENALDLKAEGLILVENWEPFTLFDDLDFPVPEAWRGYPLLFRGAPNLSSQADVEKLICALGVPVISFPDLDPAGLGAALSAPGVIDLLRPGAERLRAELSGHRARPDRYLSQVGQYRAKLEASEGPFSTAWAVIKEHGAWLMQEAFFGEGMSLFSSDSDNVMGRKLARPPPVIQSRFRTLAMISTLGLTGAYAAPVGTVQRH